jgi:flagellar motor switch protein FliN/FliY
MSEEASNNEPVLGDKAMEEAGHFLDVPLKITIQLGSRNTKIREILQLKPDSILELAKSAGENIDVFINGKLIGYGEVLELEGNTGIRLTDLHIHD